MTDALLEHRSLRELIAQDLRNRILAKLLAPGEKLDVAGIASQYGVSSGSVREAAFLLESEGLVVVNPRRGITVRVVTPTDLLEVYAVREVIDVAAATIIATARNPEALDRLRAGRNRIEEGWDQGGFATGLAADLEFHALLAELSGNSRLAAISTNLADQTRLHLQPVEAADATIRARPPARIHTAIIEAIEGGDAEAIRAAFADHYAFSRTRVTHE
jgi:DNA-binding GntR family transcriptional regulator